MEAKQNSLELSEVSWGIPSSPRWSGGALVNASRSQRKRDTELKLCKL